MSGTSLITLRLPTSLVERADALLETLTDSEEESVLLGRASRSIVLRLAVLRGIENLEAQVAASGNKQAGSSVKQATPAAKRKRTTTGSRRT